MNEIDSVGLPPAIPYNELYIYYLSGKVPADARPAFKNFIGNWEEDGFSYLFFSKPAQKQIAALLGAWPKLALLDSFHMSYEAWQGAAVTSLKIGKFYVRPPWAPEPSPSGCLSIILDPGVVFGTGTHATTKDCLEAIDIAMCSGRCDSVLDLGTGTGLLALAAARCGCSRGLAVDLNALAAETAAVNVRLNGLEDRILVVRGRAEDFMDVAADLLIANIHYEIMRQLIHTAGFIEKKRFILSGLMRSEAKAVREFLGRAPVRILREWSSDGIWHTFLGTGGNAVAPGKNLIT